MFVGSWRCAAEIAACTSCAAPSMLRLRSKVSVIEVEPSALVEVIWLMPAMVENWFSSGVATAVAMVSGEAPGRLALTEMVGKSTFGSSFTGSFGYAATPNTTSAIINSAVITGRRMHRAGRFIEPLPAQASTQKAAPPSLPLHAGGGNGTRPRRFPCVQGKPSLRPLPRVRGRVGVGCAFRSRCPSPRHHLHLRAIRQQHLPVGDHLLAAGQALLDHDATAVAGAGGDHALLRRAVRAHHEHE